MVELMQDHGDGPSAVRDMYSPGQEGLHHMACFVDDVEAETARLNDLGYPTAMTGMAFGRTRFHFIDMVAEWGHMLELYRPSDALVGFYDFVAESHRNWDGSDPVRVVD